MEVKVKQANTKDNKVEELDMLPKFFDLNVQ
jgi:hypothetical protein